MAASRTTATNRIIYLITIIIAILCLYVISLNSYLLFHSLIEIATVVIAFALFTLTWNTSRFLATGYLKILGIGYGFIAIIDLFHALTYKGMGLLLDNGANLPTQLWIAARYLQALLLLAAPIYARRNLNERMFFCIAAIVAASTTALVFSGFFPDCFIVGKGLTQFKIGSEYVISLLLVVALVLFNRVRSAFTSKVFIIICAGIICTIGAELAFTSYISVYGLANMIGHVLKLIAFALLYQALVVTGLKEPYELIFHDLNESEQALHRTQEHLEELVRERTTALEDANSKLRLTRFSIEHSADAIFWMTPDARIVDVNEAACRSLGYTKDELLRLTIPDIDPFYNAEVWQQHFIDLRQLGSVKLETVHTNKNGEKFPVEVVANYVPYGKEELNCAITRNISDRKLIELYREMSREVLQLLFESGELKNLMPSLITLLKSRTGFDAVGIRLQDGDDFPYYAEGGFPKDLLMKENSLIARTADGGVCHDENGNACLECTCGLVITGKIEPGHPLFTPGGSFWTNDPSPVLDLSPDVDPRINPRNECFHHNYASVALIPIRSKERIIGLIQFNDHRKNRFTLDSVEILEGIASHIGSALMRKKVEDVRTKLESQLLQAQKMESVGRLAGGVAHDFNNLLTVILGGAHLALSELEPDQPLHEYVTLIKNAGEKSAELTQQLLAFARKQTIEPKILDLNDSISGMLKMLQRLIGENTQLAWLPSNNLWAVKADPSQIDQILANLCVNARDSITDIGTITIRTGNSVVDDGYRAELIDVVPGEYVHISVCDTGCGMDKETLAHIFEPFFTTKGPGEGTGLGLATVYGAAKQNNGFVNVYSELGIGTTFTIYLPRFVGNANHKSSNSQTQPTPRGLETILLVEDESAILNMTTMILKKLGYTVMPACNPIEAISIANEHSEKIDLLITDVIMPEMNGKELARNLMLLNPQLKTLFMSGYTADVIAHHGVLEEGTYFIHKPFALPDLAEKVRIVFDSMLNA